MSATMIYAYAEMRKKKGKPLTDEELDNSLRGCALAWSEVLHEMNEAEQCGMDYLDYLEKKFLEEYGMTYDEYCLKHEDNQQ